LPTVTAEAPVRSEPLDTVPTPAPPGVTHAPAKHLSVGESVVRGALALLSTQPLTWGASLLSTALLPSLLGADAFGHLTLALTITTLVGTASGLGLPDYLVRRVAQHPDTVEHDLGIALLLQTATAVVGALLVAGLVPIIAPGLLPLPLLYVALGALLVVPAQSVLLTAFRGREQHTQYAWFNASGAVLGQVAGALALLLGAGVVVYAIVTGLSTLLCAVVAWKLSRLRPVWPRVERKLAGELREFAWGGFPFLTWTLTMSITGGIDRLLLGVFTSAVQVGWYAAAFRVFSIPVFIPNLIVTPLFPALSRSARDPLAIRRTIARTVRMTLLLMIPMTAGTIVVAPAIPSLLGWPDDFANAVPLIALLSLQLPIVATDSVLGVVLMAIGRQGRWVTVGVLATGFKIVANLVAIPLFEAWFGNGAIGAAIVTALCEALMCVGAILLIPKHLLDPRIAWDAIRISVAGVATVLIGAALLPFALALAIVGGAAAFFLVAVVLRVLTRDDVQLLMSRVRRKDPELDVRL
jgi:O-antigen/teichoic acid export membrane protein